VNKLFRSQVSQAVAIFLFMSLLGNQLAAQTYTIDAVNGDTIATCSGNFYDSGSNTGTYSNNERSVVTFHAPIGNRIKFDFTALDLRSEGGDTLKIFDGMDTLSTVIGSYTGTGLSFSVESTDSALTFLFSSDGALVNNGWEASISCCPIPVTSAITGNSDICEGTTGVTYSVVNTPGSTYQWFITGGTQVSGTNTNSITVDWGNISGPGKVQVVENNGCTYGDTVSLAVNVNPLPTVSFTGLDSVYQMTDSPVTLTGNPSGGTFTGDGISGDQFDPAAAGLGSHMIIYTYSDVNSCGNSDTLYTDVRNFDQQAGAIWLTDLNNWCSLDAQYTNASATADGGTPSCWSSAPGNNVWFKFKATTNAVTVDVKTGGSFGSMRGQQIALWNEAGVLVKCIEAANYFGGTLPLSIDTLTAGHTYYISVDDRTTHGTFSLCIDNTASNDYQSGAFDISDITAYCSADAEFDNTYATPDGNSEPNWTGDVGNNLWFKFNALSNGVQVKVETGTPAGSMRGQQIALWNEAGDLVKDVEAANYFSGTLSLSVDTLTAGHTYYISVDDRTTHGTFKLCVDDSISYDYHAGAKTISNIDKYQSADAAYSNEYMTPDGDVPPCWTGAVGNNVWFKFDAVSNVVKADVITGGSYGTMRGQQIALWNEVGDLVQCSNAANYYAGTLSLQTDSLTAGHTYWLSVDDRTTHGTFTLAVDNQVDYDYKIGAKYLIDQTAWSSADAEYDNTYATPDENAGSCWTGGVGNNVWFKFDAATPSIAASVLTGGTKGSMRGQQIALWNANNEQVACINANNYYSGKLTLSTDTLTVGHTYWISVDDRTTHGTFTLELDNKVPFDLKSGAQLLLDLDHWCSADAVYDNTYATPDELPGDCWTGGVGNNVWFKLVAISGEIQVDVKTGGSYGTMRGQQIALWNEAGDEVGCADAANYYSGTLTLTADTLIPGHTYYISVDDRTTHGTFSLCVNNKAGYDYQAGAKTLSHISSFCSSPAIYTNAYATADGNDPSCWTGGAGNNVWFKFTATTTDLTFDVKTGGTYGTMRGQQIAVWNEAGDLVKCAESNNYFSGTLSSSIDTLTVGHTYWVSVDDRTTHGTFSVCISNLVDYDYQKGAITLTNLSNWSSGSAAYANTYDTPDGSVPSCWTGGPGNNVWFKFVATTNSINVDVTTGGADGTMRGQQIALWNANGDEVKCADAANYYSGELSLSTDTLTIGHTYWISVDDRTTHGSFTIGVDDTPSYDFRQGAIWLYDLDNWTSSLQAYSNTYATPDETGGSCWTGGVGNNVWFKFVAISGEIDVRALTGTTYGTMRGQQIALWNEAGQQVQCANADNYYSGSLSATIDTLTPGHTYYISVDDRTTHGTFTLYVNNKVGYDFQQGAVELTQLDHWCSASQAYTNRYATEGEDTGGCWINPSHANVWFSFDAIFDTLKVDVSTGSGAGTMSGQEIVVVNANHQEVGCATSANYFTGTLSLLVDTLTPGHKYWIGVDDRTNSGTFSLCVNNVSDVDYWAIASGNWNVASNWSHSENGPPATTPPSRSNNVHIKGYNITVTDDEQCANLYTEVSGNSTSLTVNGGNLTVNGNLELTNSGENYDGTINLPGGGVLNVTRDFNMTRAGGDNLFQVNLSDNSQLNVNNDVNVTSSAGSVNAVEINSGNTARITIGNDLNMQNSGGPQILITTNDDARTTVTRNIVYDATGSNQIVTELNDNASLWLAGNFDRGASEYGILTCNNNSTLVLNGQSYIQNLPKNAGGGTDEFTYQNITIDNSKVTSPQVILDGDVSMFGTLTLIQGIVETTSASLLTIENGGAATGASQASFVDGPLRKIGNQAFDFPIGNSEIYKPISIAAPVNATDEFTAQYFNESPSAVYDTTLHAASITYINRCEYWTLGRSAGSSDVNATLYWDTNSCCISDLANLKVTAWNGSQWDDNGNGGTTGTTTAGSIVTSVPVTSDNTALTFANSLQSVSFTGLGTQYCANDADVTLTGFPKNDVQSFSGPGISDNGDGTAVFSPSAAGAGTHEITYTFINSTSGCSNSTTQSVTVLPRPTANIVGTDLICPRTSADLSIVFTGTGPWDYTYTDGVNSFSGTSSTNPYDFTTSNTGTYAVTMLQDANGCIANDFGTSATVDAFPDQAIPIITPSGPTTFCEGGSVTLTSSASATFYFWSNGATTQSIDVTESGSYSVQTRDANGCLSEWSDPIDVVVNPLPGKAGQPSGNNTLCQFNGTEVYTTPGAADANATEYVWTLSPASAGTITGNTTSATVQWDNTFTGTATITVQGHNSCGFGLESNPLSITMNSSPVVDLGLDRTVCGSETLDAGNAGSSYLWSTGAVAQSISALFSGDYWVKVTSGNGCSNRDTVALVIRMPATFTTQPVSQNECVGSNIQLSVSVTGTGPFTYQWQKDGTDLTDGGNVSGSQTSILSVNNVLTTDGGTYRCIVTNYCGDAPSDPATVVVNSLPATSPITTDN